MCAPQAYKHLYPVYGLVQLGVPDGIGRLEYCIAFRIDQHIFIYLSFHECNQYCLNVLYDVLNTVVSVQPSSLRMQANIVLMLVCTVVNIAAAYILQISALVFIHTFKRI